jgi:hypothetical protein
VDAILKELRLEKEYAIIEDEILNDNLADIEDLRQRFRDVQHLVMVHHSGNYFRSQRLAMQGRRGSKDVQDPFDFDGSSETEEDWKKRIDIEIFGGGKDDFLEPFENLETLQVFIPNKPQYDLWRKVSFQNSEKWEAAKYFWTQYLAKLRPELKRRCADAPASYVELLQYNLLGGWMYCFDPYANRGGYIRGAHLLWGMSSAYWNFEIHKIKDDGVFSRVVGALGKLRADQNLSVPIEIF